MTTAAHPTVYSLEGVSLSIDGNPILQNLSFNISKGERVYIVGRSGAGKSQLLSLLCGLRTPDSGNLEVMGTPTQNLDERGWYRLREHIGFVFQNGALLDSLTVEQNISLKLRDHLDWPEEKIRQKVAEVSEQVLLSPGDLSKYPAALSGGMLKRAAIARAIAYSPAALLYDEPTTGLDPQTASAINNLILRLSLQSSCTSITISHDLEAARTQASRILFIDAHRIYFDGTPPDFFSSENPFVRLFLSGC